MTTRNRQLLGATPFFVGSFWFTLAFFWLPPLMLIFGRLRLPHVFYAVLLRIEFVVSALMAATGALLWYSSTAKLCRFNYFVAYSLALLAIIAVYFVYR